MDGATMGSYLEMLRAVKFVLDTKTFCLKIHPKIENKIVTVTGLEILKQGLVLQDLSFIY
jgi:hypothetical protein